MGGPGESPESTFVTFASRSTDPASPETSRLQVSRRASPRPRVQGPRRPVAAVGALLVRRLLNHLHPPSRLARHKETQGPSLRPVTAPDLSGSRLGGPASDARREGRRDSPWSSDPTPARSTARPILSAPTAREITRGPCVGRKGSGPASRGDRVTSRRDLGAPGPRLRLDPVERGGGPSVT